MKKVKKLDNCCNILPSYTSKLTQLCETTPSFPSSVTESKYSNVASSFLVIKLKFY